MACAFALAGAADGQAVEPCEALRRLTEQLWKQQRQVEALQAALADQAEGVKALRVRLVSPE